MTFDDLINPFETDKTPANDNLKLCLKPKPQVNFSEVYQQDKPRTVRRAPRLSIKVKNVP